jgi:hypothetical protein
LNASWSQVLNDPKQRRFFTAKNIRDLFTLGEEYDKRTETERIFHEVDSNVRIEEYVPAVASETATATELQGGSTGEAAPLCFCQQRICSDWYVRLIGAFVTRSSAQRTFTFSSGRRSGSNTRQIQTLRSLKTSRTPFLFGDC